MKKKKKVFSVFSGLFLRISLLFLLNKYPFICVHPTTSSPRDGLTPFLLARLKISQYYYFLSALENKTENGDEYKPSCLRGGGGGGGGGG